MLFIYMCACLRTCLSHLLAEVTDGFKMRLKLLTWLIIGLPTGIIYARADIYIYQLWSYVLAYSN